MGRVQKCRVDSYDKIPASGVTAIKSVINTGWKSNIVSLLRTRSDLAEQTGSTVILAICGDCPTRM
jgi:hypothetical protein